MNKTKSLLTAVAAGAAFAAFPAAAQVGVSNVYVGAGIGQSKEKDVDCNGFAECDQSGNSFKAFAGYQINRNFAFEAGYQDFGKFVIGNGAGTSSSLKSHAWEAMGVAALPLSPNFSIYGKAGLYYASSKADLTTPLGTSNTEESNTGLSFGGGLQYDFGRNLGLRGEWQRYTNVGGGTVTKTDIDVFNVGVLWRFR